MATSINDHQIGINRSWICQLRLQNSQTKILSGAVKRTNYRLFFGFFACFLHLGPNSSLAHEIVMSCRFQGSDVYLIFDDKYSVIWSRIGVLNISHKVISTNRNGTNFTDYVVLFEHGIDGQIYEADYSRRQIRMKSSNNPVQCR